jgi:hypothetical protein
MMRDNDLIMPLMIEYGPQEGRLIGFVVDQNMENC